jgi:hypothetical protein
VLPGETIDLGKLIGACCTLVISHQQNLVGKTYASIDAVSKPTRKVLPSGQYDPAAARQRFAEWKAKQGVEGRVSSVEQAVPAPNAAAPVAAPPVNAPSKSGAATPPPGPSRTGQDYDPEVGF